MPKRNDMISRRKALIAILFVLVSAGLLFYGYLSAVNLFGGTSAFNESCSYFLGYSACWYGFAMYLIMFLVTGFGLLERSGARNVFLTDVVVSICGIFFAGSFVEGVLTIKNHRYPWPFNLCVRTCLLRFDFHHFCYWKPAG